MNYVQYPVTEVEKNCCVVWYRYYCTGKKTPGRAGTHIHTVPVQRTGQLCPGLPAHPGVFLPHPVVFLPVKDTGGNRDTKGRTGTVFLPVPVLYSERSARHTAHEPQFCDTFSARTDVLVERFAHDRSGTRFWHVDSNITALRC